MKIFRTLYDKTIDYAGHRHAIWYLAVISFIESSVFPIPPDIMLLPMMLANRNKAFLYALVCTVASVLGGVFGYFIGWGFYDIIGQYVFEFYGYNEGFDEFRKLYNEQGDWIVGMAGLTPFPYKIITIASGIVGMNLMLFVLISILSRGIRFFALAVLLWFFGPSIRSFIEKYFGLLTIAFFVLLIAGFAAIHYLL